MVRDATRRWLTIGASAVVVAGLVAGCSSAPSPGGKQSGKSATSAGKGGESQGSPGSDPTQPGAEFAQLKNDLLTKDVGSLKGDGVSVEILNTPLQPSLAMTQEVVRMYLLRQRAEAGKKSPLTVQSKLVASSSSAVAVAISAKGEGSDGTAVVVYDVATNTSFASSALIQPSKWGEFTQKVAGLAADKRDAVTAALGKPGWPYGEGPALAFNSQGDLVVSFPASVAVGNLSIPGDEAAPLLTILGDKTRAAARYPAAAGKGGRPKPGVNASSDKGGAPSATAQPSSSASPGDAAAGTRPTVVVGPDCTKLKCVALTFDDGPVGGTNALLDVLAKSKVPATFFVLGNSVQNEGAVVTREALMGQPVASHNWRHTQMTKASPALLEQNMKKNSAEIRRLTGQSPLFLRPPYGDRNARVDAAIGKQNMAIALWDVDTLDWKVSGSANAEAAIMQKVSQQTGNGSVILIHDIHDSSRAAVPAIIKYVQAQGYTMVTLSELGPNSGYDWGKKFCSAPMQKSSCNDSAYGG